MTRLNGLRAPSLLISLGLLPIVVLVTLHHAIASESSSTLTELERMPRHKSDADEPDEARRVRLAEIAGAIDAVARDRSERAMLVVLGAEESHFARDVCAGDRLGDKGRAYGCFQSHDPDRSGGVRGQAERAIRDLRRARNYCSSRTEDRLEGAFALYGSGMICSAPWAKKRADRARRVEARL